MTITTTRRGWRRGVAPNPPLALISTPLATPTSPPRTPMRPAKTTTTTARPQVPTTKVRHTPDEQATRTEASLISTGFASLGIDPRLDAALARAELVEPTPIQAAAIPAGLEGRDVAGCARTGSGKTLAFGLVMISRLAGASSRPGHPRGLVLVPTRELAAQVTGVLAPWPVRWV